MTADISRRNGRDLVAVNVSRGHPWHMLGEAVDKDMTIDEALRRVGVEDEKIRIIPLYYRDPPLTDDDENWEEGYPYQETEVPDTFGVYSNVFGLISTVGNRWHPTQRRAVLQKAYDITGLSDGSAHIDTIGNLGENGDTFFAYIRVPDLVIDPKGIADTIERGLFVANSYNETLRITLGYSNIRPVCRNTVCMALGNLQQTISIKNTVNAEDRLQEAAAALHYVGAVELQVAKRAEKMLRTTDGDKALNALLDEFWDVEDESLNDAAITRRNHQRNTVRRLYEGPTNIEAVGRNGWAAYNAVVEFWDHEREVRGKEADKGLIRARAAVLPGKVVNDKVKASEIVLSLN